MRKLRKYGIIFLVLLMALMCAPMAMAATEIGQNNIGDLFKTAGDYILSEDIVLNANTKAIELSKDFTVTLDLNGHVVSSDTSVYRKTSETKYPASIIYATSGDITIKDSQGGGKLLDVSTAAYGSNNDGVIRVKNGAKLTVEKAIIEVKNGIGITTYDDGTRVTFKDGEINVEYGFGIATNGTNITEPGSGIYVEGGKITVASADSAAIYHPSSGTLSISGGELSAADGIQVKAGTVMISGGTITASGDHKVPADGVFSGGGTNELGNALSLISHKSYKGASMDVTISGSATLISEQTNAIETYISSGDVDHVKSFKITGGTYSSDPKDYVREPYVVKKTGNEYTVVLAGVVVTPDTAELVLDFAPVRTLTASSDITEDFTWASENESVVTVDGNGNITAVGAGTANVTATGVISESVNKCVVTVRKAAPVSVTPANMELKIGETGKVEAKYDAKDSVSWSSSNQAVATVKDGTVTAGKKAGVAIITAKGTYTSAACTLTVIDPVTPDPTPTPAPVDPGTVGKDKNPVNNEKDKPENVEAATPAIKEATEDAKDDIAGATNIKKENLVATANGTLTISPVLAKSALEEVMSADKEVAPKNVVLLPIVSTNVKEKNVAAMAFSMTGAQLGAEDGTVAGDVKIIKVLADGKGAQFGYASSAAGYQDETFTLKDANDKTLALTDKVVKTSDYKLIIFVADDGKFDLDKTPGSVVDPIAVATNAAKPAPTPHSSSSGCNAGFAGLLLLAAVPFIYRRKR
ncbi:Ig-like domain-containing protein [Cloacibacillus porcorum]|uniref:Ig-like domain-containing protein n=1 Tax=Cloacibacillus porcorum TaxID=1197717 RepID=UPI003D004997